MLNPFTEEIDRLTLVFAHCGRESYRGNRIYAVAARTLFAHRPPADFDALVRYPPFGVREHHYSNLNREAILSAEAPGRVKEGLAAFLDHAPLILLLDPFGDLDHVAAFCGGPRVVDLSFAAEFFLPQLPSYAPAALWEYLNKNRRRRLSFSAGEMVDLGQLLLTHIGSEVLNARLHPRAAALTHYLHRSETLFGRVMTHLVNQYQAYFGELLSPGSIEGTPDWRRFLERVKPGPPPEIQSGDLRRLEARHLEELFSALAGAGRGFRRRPSQQAYAGHIAEALNKSAILCLEAGTGTGKTLGYLLPVLGFLARNPLARAIISTYTKNLQEQLFEREWPVGRELLPLFRDIPAVLLKGKGSYLCAEKLDLINSPGLTGGARLAWLYLVQLIYHFRHTDVDGVGEKVGAWLDDRGLLSAMLAEATAANGCTHRHVHCPAQIVTTEARRARLVVTNHHKLALVGGDPGFSGRFRTVVIDEANHFEYAVRSAYQTEVASHELGRLLRIVAKPLKAAHSRAAGEDLAPLKRAQAAHTALYEEMRALHGALAALHPMARPGEVKELIYHHEAYRDGALSEHLSALLAQLARLVKGLESFADADRCRRLRIQSRTALRVGHAAGALSDAAAEIKGILLNAEHQQNVAAYALFGRHWTLTLQEAEVSGLIRERVFPDRDGLVFTAATLCYRDSFRSFRRIVGLDRPIAPAGPEMPAKTVLEAVLPSPFDPTALRVAVPVGALNGNFNNKTAWLAAVADLLPDLVHRNRGRTLVLFASYSDLEAIAARIEAPLSVAGYPLLVQRKGGATVTLCDDFRTIKESVLLGVDTFWYGVDFKGDTLTQVIITRIPYPSPADPLQVVRQRADNRGYWERYHYDTFIKLRQGVGRLIRSETDRGRVIFLDTRIRTHSLYKQLAASSRFRSGVPDGGGQI
jgi:ATP-dependent DNA helicase DinG